MAKPLFVDETAFIALNSPIATNHEIAIEYVSSLIDKTVRVVTNEWVVALTAGELKQKAGAQTAARFLELLNEGGIVILPMRDDIYEHAEALFLESSHIVDLTYIDCIHVSFMEAYHITTMFTFKPQMSSMNVLVAPKNRG